MPPQLIAEVEAWAEANDTSRSDAFRRLVELGLTVTTTVRLKSEDTKHRAGTKERARELAGDAIDEMSDTTASVSDQDNRRRRLIGGPEEFQRVRRDRDRPNRK